jgi:cGMP-dependent protein kinase
MGSSCTKDKSIKESVVNYDHDNKKVSGESIKPNTVSVNKNTSQVNKRSSVEEVESISVRTTIPVKRHNSKKKNLGMDNAISSKETEVLQILKNSNPALEDLALLDKCLMKNLFMRNLEKQARVEVIKKMMYCFVPKNTIIFEQGTTGIYFYIIKEGKVSLAIDNDIKKSLNPGESFGDLALLHGAVRSGTIKAVEDTHVWCLERKKFKQIVDYITNKNFEENKSFIMSIPILNNMDSNFITRLSSNMIGEIYDPGAYIVKEGEAADCMYIIKEGTVVCTRKEEVIRSLTRGDFFGTTSILMESTRTLNVIAQTNCVCYSISVKTLVDLLGDGYKNTLYLNFIKMAMNKSKHFNKINNNLIENTYPAFKPLFYGKNSVVYPKGTNMSQKVAIIIEGNLIRSKSSSDDEIDSSKRMIAERGHIVLEDSIFNSKIKGEIDYDLLSYPDCLVVEADLKVFTNLLGGPLEHIAEKSSLIESLSKVPLFKQFSLNKIKSLAEYVYTEDYSHDQHIIKEGEEGSKFYIVKSGKVDIFVKNQYLRTLNELEFFGERSLFVKELRSATAIAIGNVSVYVLSEEHFIKIVDENFKEHMVQRISLQDNTITLKDLDYIQNLGAGNFGNVFLVQSKKNKCLYALKAISKNQIDQEQLHPNLEMEKRILLQIDHPFIMKLVKSLKDEKDIYFLMEYVRGKELWDVIRDIGLLNKQQTLFYGCSLFLAVEYLHSRKFVYRDIKPENVMVAEKV